MGRKGDKNNTPNNSQTLEDYLTQKELLELEERRFNIRKQMNELLNREQLTGKEVSDEYEQNVQNIQKQIEYSRTVLGINDEIKNIGKHKLDILDQNLSYIQKIISSNTSDLNLKKESLGLHLRMQENIEAQKTASIEESINLDRINHILQIRDNIVRSTLHTRQREVNFQVEINEALDEQNKQEQQNAVDQLNRERAIAQRRLGHEKYIERVQSAKESVLDIERNIQEVIEQERITGESITSEQENLIELINEAYMNRGIELELDGSIYHMGQEKLGILEQELDFFKKLTDSKRSIRSLSEELLDIETQLAFAELSGDEEDRLQYQRDMVESVIDQRREIIRVNNELRLQNQISEDIENNINDMFETFESGLGNSIPFMNKFKAYLENAKFDPLSGAIASATFLFMTFKDINSQLDSIGQTFGALGLQSQGMRIETARILKDNMELNISMKELAPIMSYVSSNFGETQVITTRLAEDMAHLGMSIGISGQEAGQLENIFINFLGLTADSAKNVIRHQTAFAKTQKLVPSAVMAQMAKSTEFVAKYSRDTGDNILNAAMAATKLGISLDSIGNTANTVLDFQSSISREFELSAILGKTINFNEARRLFMLNDTAGGIKSVMDQLQGINLDNVDPITFDMIASSIGKSSEELRKMMTNGGKLQDLTEATQLNVAMTDIDDITPEKSLTAFTKLQNKIKNIGRAFADDIISNMPQLEGFINSISGGLDSVIGIVKSIGLGFTAIIVSLGGMVFSVRSLTTAITQLNLSTAQARYMQMNGSMAGFQAPVAQGMASTGGRMIMTMGKNLLKTGTYVYAASQAIKGISMILSKTASAEEKKSEYMKQAFGIVGGIAGGLLGAFTTVGFGTGVGAAGGYALGTGAYDMFVNDATIANVKPSENDTVFKTDKGSVTAFDAGKNPAMQGMASKLDDLSSAIKYESISRMNSVNKNKEISLDESTMTKFGEYARVAFKDAMEDYGLVNNTTHRLTNSTNNTTNIYAT